MNAVVTNVAQIFAGASAGSDKRVGSEGPNTFPSFRSVMTTTSEITDAAGTELKLKVAKTQVGGWLAAAFGLLLSCLWWCMVVSSLLYFFVVLVVMELLLSCFFGGESCSGGHGIVFCASFTAGCGDEMCGN